MQIFSKSDPLIWGNIQIAYLSLQSVESTGEPTPVLIVMKNWLVQVKNALYQWWLSDGNQILSDAETKFITWFKQQGPIVNSIEYSEDWLS